MRHGLAADLDSQGLLNDAARPLTPQGERKLRAITKWMGGMELSFDLIWFSPCLRARQTAAIVAHGLQAEGRLKAADCLLPQAQPGKVVEALRRLAPQPESVLLVGHEPGLSELISLLATGTLSLGIALKKGGLCKLRAESLEPGRVAVLEWLLTPKQMIRGE